MIEVLDTFPDDIVAICAHGQVNKSDYIDVLAPAIEDALTRHDKIAFWYETAADFSGYTLGAMEEDALVGLQHLLQIRRAAIISDIDWIRLSAAAFRVLIPCPVRAFSASDTEAARVWLLTNEGAL